MLSCAFNIYPIGHYYLVPYERRYRAGRRLVDRFKANGFEGRNDYSILLYDTDRIKIEIESNQEKLSQALFETVLRREREDLTIVCWESITPEDNHDVMMKLKLIATALREQLPERDPFNRDLCEPDKRGWRTLIQTLPNLLSGQWAVTGGESLLNEILAKWQNTIRGFQNIPQNPEYLRCLRHFILNPLGYEYEKEVIQNLPP